MAQHFLLSKSAKTLSLAHVFQMTDAAAEIAFRKVRWAETDGAPVCPHCGGLDAYDCRRLKGAPRFRCRACVKDFTITSGTLFASHKLPLRCYLAAIAIFCNEGKGKSALALSRDLSVSYKCAFVLLHKLREAMAEELKGRTVGGEGKTVEVDGGYFGGYIKPANNKELRRDRRLAKNQNGKRKVVVIVRERHGNSVPAVFKTEAQAASFIKARVAKGTTIQADEAGSWDSLHDRFEVKRINHQEAYSMDGACTNWAEEFFSRMRRAEIGHHHHISGAYLLRYAQEATWREDNRRVSNGDQVEQVAGLALKRGKSVSSAATFDKSNPAAIGYTNPEVDVRGLFGYGFTAGWPTFIDVQVAQRFRLGGPPDEFRADITLGTRPLPRWLLLLQSFNVISEGAGSLGFASYSYEKLQLSAVYSITPAMSVQLGGFTTFAGRNALQENGLVLSGWYKF